MRAHSGVYKTCEHTQESVKLMGSPLQEGRRLHGQSIMGETGMSSEPSKMPALQTSSISYNANR